MPTVQWMPWSEQVPRLQGQGIFAKRSIPKHTFVGEYLGELYAPWRWFEKQDLLRKRNPTQSLPDFYNICLERPPEVHGGRDVVFVEVRSCLHLASLAGLFVNGGTVCTCEVYRSVRRKSAVRAAASSLLMHLRLRLLLPLRCPQSCIWQCVAAAASSQVSNAVQAADRGDFASRLSHSCGPNCRNVAVVVAGSRITNALFTIEDIAAGEELCWDYACVTESEREYRAAICLCASLCCRGSFLYYANSTTFQGVNHRRPILLSRL